MTKQELNRIWDRLNKQYEKAQDKGNKKLEGIIWRQMRLVNSKIEAL